MTRTYFGNVDASEAVVSEADLAKFFVPNSAYLSPDEMSPDSPCIFVGLKGSGKTALGRYMAKQFNGVAWFRDEKNAVKRFAASGNIPRSGTSSSTLTLFVLEQLYAHLSSQGMISQSKLEATRKALSDIGEKFLKSAKVKVGFLSFDFENFFDSQNHEEISASIQKLLGAIKNAVGDRPILIVLDDIDSYFDGIENHPRFIESLFRAVSNLNRVKDPNIRCVLFVKHGIWRQLYEHPEEYDKVKYQIEFISWSKEEVARILAKRVALIHGMDLESLNFDKNILKILKKEFFGTNPDVNKSIEFLYKMSANGPRDVIDICNRAKFSVGADRKIDIDVLHSDEIQSKYSDEKIRGLAQDFDHLYPYISEFAQGAFKEFRAEFPGQELVDHLDSGILNTLSDAKESYGQQVWCRDATAGAVVKILYDVGVIGIRQADGTPLFSLEDATKDQGALVDSNLLVHFAYRRALGFKGSLPDV